MTEQPAEARVHIDRGSGEIVHCDEAALSLLGAGREMLAGQPWTQALGCREPYADALRAALASRRRAWLPPFLVTLRDGREAVLGAMTCPGSDPAGESPAAQGEDLLLFWEESDPALPGLTAPPGPADTIALLGMDPLPGAADGAPQVAALQAGLADIVRPQDEVSAVAGLTLAIVLRDVDLEAASDICTALLSHLHRAQRERSPLRIGMARMAPERSALGTLLAANHALLVCRAEGKARQLHRASPEDYPRLAAAAVHGAGLFGGAPRASSPAPAPVVAIEKPAAPPVQPIERDIDGYVIDNMEGAVDQAMFLAGLDMPVAIVGPAGTGKMYVARILHDEGGSPPDMLVAIDCREFRSRNDANAAISRELAACEGRTLVFKSPHLMNAEAQQKLARQLSTRRLADTNPREALPMGRFVGLFPDTLERLVQRGELHEQLASAFAGMPITVPPIRDRKQAVLRWAHKILGQEGLRRDRDMRGFTPDAERALLLYPWPGNISEMRQCISDALDKTDKDWLTPVDLGLFGGIEAGGTAALPESRPYLDAAEGEGQEEEAYAPTTLETLDLSLAGAVHALLGLEAIKPLGTWLEDDLVAATVERYRGDHRRAAEFLHTRPRNISRWLPKVAEREEDRVGSALWQESRRRLREWVRESPPLPESPLLLLQGRLLRHVEDQAAGLSAARRAGIMGVSTPTYLKRLREIADG